MAKRIASDEIFIDSAPTIFKPLLRTLFSSLPEDSLVLADVSSRREQQMVQELSRIWGTRKAIKIVLAGGGTRSTRALSSILREANGESKVVVSSSSTKDANLVLQPNTTNNQVIKLETSGLAENRLVGKANDKEKTQMQELVALYIFKRAIQDNKTFRRWQDIKNDQTTIDHLNKIWDEVSQGAEPRVQDEWLESFWAANRVLVSKVGGASFTEFSRGGGPFHGSEAYIPDSKQSDTFMDWIEKDIIDKYFSDVVSGSASNKDNWNPADVWLIQNETKHRQKIHSIVVAPSGFSSTADIGEVVLAKLNGYMRHLFRTKQIWGISLKKISGTAKFMRVNTTEKFLKDMDWLSKTGGYKYDKSHSYFDLVRGETLTSQDTRVFVKGKGTEYNFQIKANSSSGFSPLKFEPTEKGAGAARMGKATIDYLKQLMDVKIGSKAKTFEWSPIDYPQTQEEWLDYTTQAEYRRKFGDLVRLGVNLSKGDRLSLQEVMDNITTTFDENNQPHVANSKLMQVSWLHLVLTDLKKARRNKFFTDMVLMSAKQGRRYGPFAKIY